MNHRRMLLLLVTILIVLALLFAVLMAFQALFAALGDSTSARILFGFAIACLIGMVVDLLLLVGALGVLAAWEDGSESRRAESHPPENHPLRSPTDEEVP